MPQAVAAAAASYFSGAAVTGFATAAGGVGVSAISVGFGTAVVYGASYVATAAAIAYGTAQLSRPKGLGNLSAFQDPGRTVMSRDPIAARRKIYGQVLTTGTMYPVGVAGTNNEDFHFIVIYASHEVEEIGDLYINDEYVELDAEGGFNND